MIQYIRSASLLFIVIAISASHFSFGMFKRDQNLTSSDMDAITLFAKNLATIDLNRLMLVPEIYNSLSLKEKSDISNYRFHALEALRPPCEMIKKSNDLLTILIKGLAIQTPPSTLNAWATCDITYFSGEQLKNMQYIQDIADAALQLQTTSAPENNALDDAQNPQLPDAKQTLSFFAKSSIAAGAIGTAVLVYYWYATQKETQKNIK